MFSSLHNTNDQNDDLKPFTSSSPSSSPIQQSLKPNVLPLPCPPLEIFCEIIRFYHKPSIFYNFLLLSKKFYEYISNEDPSSGKNIKFVIDNEEAINDLKKNFIDQKEKRTINFVFFLKIKKVSKNIHLEMFNNLEKIYIFDQDYLYNSTTHGNDDICDFLKTIKYPMKIKWLYLYRCETKNYLRFEKLERLKISYFSTHNEKEFFTNENLGKLCDLKVLKASNYSRKKISNEIFGKLKKLENLYIGGNELFTAVFQNVEFLEQLKVLSIHCFIPVGIKNFGKLINLKKLKISYVEDFDVKFSDIEVLKNLKNLQTLRMSNIGITDKQIGCFYNLERLTAGNCIKISRNGLLGLKKLRELSFQNSPIKINSFSGFNFTKLEIINCKNVSGDLSNMDKLKMLVIKGSEKVNFVDKMLKDLNIEMLVLINCEGITGECFNMLSKIIRLGIISCKNVTDVNISKLNNLKELRVDEIYRPLGKIFFENKNKLEKLQIDKCRFEKQISIVEGFGKLNNLKEIVLKNDYVIGDKEIEKLVNLRRLTLYNSSGVNGNCFKNLEKLTFLSVCFNRNLSAKELTPLKKIHKIYLFNCSNIKNYESLKKVRNCKMVKNILYYKNQYRSKYHFDRSDFVVSI